MRLKSIIYKSAKEVRELCEDIQKLSGDYSENLAGMCAIGSYQLFARLHEMGLEPRLGVCDRHICVLCGKYFVDITATQFSEYDFKPIEIRKFHRVKKKPETERWRVYQEINNPKDMMEQFVNWEGTNEHPILQLNYIKGLGEPIASKIKTISC